MELYKIIRKLRLEYQLTQRQLEQESSVSQERICMIENNKPGIRISTDEINALAKAFKMKPSAMVKLSESIDNWERCVNCEDGVLPTLNRSTLVYCPICSGTGKMPPSIEYNQVRGQALRDDAKANGLSLLQNAVRLGKSTLDVAMMYRGFFRKDDK